MEPENWQQIEQIIDTALSMQKSERGKYVAKACKGDEQLRTKVTELLTSIETSRKENYLQGNAYHELKTDLPETIEQYSGKSLIGQKIDRYEIIDLIGHGGMGSVYLANRSDGAYEQKVALKLLRRGMDTPSNIARFERERQILAQLNHPNIAQLLDGGVTKDGLPYLIMEYVDGIPIHEFCNEHHLPVEDRLQLFRSVCNTVQYTHTNAVIHRDLKPSNILITAEGSVKILDFGIAKLLEPKNPERVLFRTQTGARMLTIAYAAPEQVEAKPITTATDTYTLGILLFQLLTGVHPFDLENKDLNEIENVIRNQTPAKPSVRFSKLPDDKQNQILKNRGASSSALIKKLGGDLDAIIMKALRKEAKARYISANNFWEDIRRANNNLPVIAREDTFRYKSKKFLKRHQSSLFTAAGFLILITAFVSFYTWQITQERDYAQTEAQKAEEVTKFLTNLIESNYPENAQGDTITVRAFLNRGFERVQQLDDSPAVKANIMQVMANTYRSLGELQKAHTLIDRVIQMHETWNFSSSETAEAYNKYGMIQRDRGNYEKAVEAL